jgi:flavorubredoxin
MKPSIDEIAEGIYRISVHVPDIAPPAGFTFNQFLIDAEEPMLFHTGLRRMFPIVLEAVQSIMPVERLRWISFGHFEADECGALNEWLAVAPHAEPAHGQIGAMVSLQDFADRPPRVLADGEVLDIGGRQIRYIDTPHVPHGWDAGVIHEETTGTLFCGDLFTHVGDTPALTGSDIVEPAIASESVFHATSLGASTAPNIRKLAGLAPRKLAVMHGASFEGDCASALNALADYYDNALRDALPKGFMDRP